MKKTVSVISVLFLFLILIVNAMAAEPNEFCGGGYGGGGGTSWGVEGDINGTWLKAYVAKDIREQCVALLEEAKQQCVSPKPTVKKCFDTPVDEIITFAGNNVPEQLIAKPRVAAIVAPTGGTALTPKDFSNTDTAYQEWRAAEYAWANIDESTNPGAKKTARQHADARERVLNEAIRSQENCNRAVTTVWDAIYYGLTNTAVSPLIQNFREKCYN